MFIIGKKLLFLIIVLVVPTVKLESNYSKNSIKNNYFLSFDKPPLKTICEYNKNCDKNSTCHLFYEKVFCKVDFRTYDSQKDNSLYDFKSSSWKHEEYVFESPQYNASSRFTELKPTALSNSSFVLIGMEKIKHKQYINLRTYVKKNNSSTLQTTAQIPIDNTESKILINPESSFEVFYDYHLANGSKGIFRSKFDKVGEATDDGKRFFENFMLDQSISDIDIINNNSTEYLVIRRYLADVHVYNEGGKEIKRIPTYLKKYRSVIPMSNDFDVVTFCFEFGRFERKPKSYSIQCLQLDSKWNTILNNTFTMNHKIKDSKVYNIKNDGYVLLVRSINNTVFAAEVKKNNTVPELKPIDDIGSCNLKDYYLINYGLKRDVQFAYSCNNEKDELILHKKPFIVTNVNSYNLINVIENVRGGYFNSYYFFKLASSFMTSMF